MHRRAEKSVMFHRVTRAYTMDAVLALMDPVIQKWFRSKFSSLTEPQSYAIPLIHRGENTLVCSPTGSGKTMTAFLSILNELFILHKRGRLENRIYCVYVSPLRALANDINRNLVQPLQEITALAEQDGLVRGVGSGEWGKRVTGNGKRERPRIPYPLPRTPYPLPRIPHLVRIPNSELGNLHRFPKSASACGQAIPRPRNDKKC